jgi:hypothetical protein
MKVLLLFIFTLTYVFAQSSSTLNENCSQEGFACGACENDMQGDFNKIIDNLVEQDLTQSEHWGDLKDDIENEASNLTFKNPMPKYEDVLDDIVSLMRNNTPGGKLNYVVIGESESLQQTSVKDGKMNPRIMLKSPNSELMVTFATDPELPGYNSIEIMRWNGKEGRYEFQELNFGDQGEPPHIDLSGKKCAECHKSPSMRPNWDTYRAWAGVVPSRDDMLEMEYNGSKMDKEKPMQPDGRAYLSFLDQVVDAKKDSNNPRSRRLAMLDIPFDDETQLKDAVEKFKEENGREPNDEEKVKMIKSHVEDEGFYRIRHFPDKTSDTEMATNFDNKTADASGPSQFAFDQMLAQNMCRVTNDLRKHPDFEKFKYGLTSIIKCNNTGSNIEDFIPESFIESIKNFHVTNGGSTMTEIKPEEKETLSEASADDIYDLLHDDTQRSHDRANDFKFNRHGKFLNSYLQGVENMSSEEAQEDALYFSEKVRTPSQYSPLQFHAISDPGGVSGVAEDSTTTLASIRLLLEPMGVKVEHWSLVNGKDTAYNSYSFSDQFVLFTTQPLFEEIKNEVERELEEKGEKTGYNSVCQELNRKSKEALEVKTTIEPNDSLIGYLENKCNERNFSPLKDVENNELVEFANLFSENNLRNDARNMLKKCQTCHQDGSPFPPEFKGLTEFIENDDDTEFVELLNSESTYSKYIEVFQDKLGVHSQTTLGSAMPPTDWDDNKEFAEEYNLDPLNVQNERRMLLGIYLTALASKSDERNEMDIICSTLFSSGLNKNSKKDIEQKNKNSSANEN